MSLLSGIGRLLLGGNCLLCAADADDGLLCGGCAGDLPRLPTDVCPRCALPRHGDDCGRCRREPPAFDTTVAGFRYEFPVDRMIHALKYGHRLGVARWLGRHLAAHPQLPADAAIVPVPLHAERLCERGFNQSLEIARALVAPGRPLLAPDVLRRTRPTTAQASLSHTDRQANVQDAFECTVDLAGRPILLIDDVLTTGHTAGEAARVLKLHGASRVTVAVAARAVAHSIDSM